MIRLDEIFGWVDSDRMWVRELHYNLYFHEREFGELLPYAMFHLRDRLLHVWENVIQES